MASRQLRPVATERASAAKGAGAATGAGAPSALANWPIQLHLMPVQAPYFQGATVLLAADCVPFAHPGFHADMLAGRILVIGCPKLDDTSAYLEKLAAIFRFNEVRAVEVAFMEVPCCHGLARLAATAIEQSGKRLPLELIKVGIDGQIQPLPERAIA